MPKGKEILRGVGGPPGVVVATVRVVNKSEEKMANVKHGEVLVAEKFAPRHNIYMEKAVAFITDVGGVTAHVLIKARGMGVPGVAGTVEATSVLKDGQRVVVDGLIGYETFYVEGKERKRPIGAVYEYIEEILTPETDKMEAFAKTRNIIMPPAVLEKMRQMERMKKGG